MCRSCYHVITNLSWLCDSFSSRNLLFKNKKKIIHSWNTWLMFIIVIADVNWIKVILSTTFMIINPFDHIVVYCCVLKCLILTITVTCSTSWIILENWYLPWCVVKRLNYLWILWRNTWLCSLIGEWCYNLYDSTYMIYVITINEYKKEPGTIYDLFYR